MPRLLLRASVIPLLALALAAPSCPQEPSDEGPGIELAPLPAPPSISIPKRVSSEELSVVAHQPIDRAYSDSTHVTVLFSRPVASLEAIGEDSSPKNVATLVPSVPGEWRWLGSNGIEFVPKDRLTRATKFQVTVKAGLEAIDGSTLKEPHTFTFETRRPEILSASPDENWRWATSNQKFHFWFSVPVTNLPKHVKLVHAGKELPLKLESARNAFEEEIEERNKENEKKTPRPEIIKVTDAQRKAHPRTHYVFTTKRLPLGESFELVVDPAVKPEEGELGMAERWTRSFRTHAPMAISGVRGCSRGEPQCPYGPLVIETMSKADPENLKELVSLSPPAEIDWDSVQSWIPWWDGSDNRPATLSLPGRFKPGTTYTVTVMPGLKDLEGSKAEGFSGTVRFDDLKSSFDLGEGVAIVESKPDGKLPIRATNIETIDCRIWKLEPADLAKQLTWTRWTDGHWAKRPVPASAAATERLEVHNRKNIPKTVPLDLRARLPEGETSGFFLVKATSPEVKADRHEGDRVQTRVVILTDLAIHAKLSPKKGLLYATRISTGRPEADVNLTVLDARGESRWAGKTDALGLAEMPGLEELQLSASWGPSALVVIGKKEGESTATWTGGEEDSSPGYFSVPTGWERSHEPVSVGSLFTERGIYRPGDTVYVKGVVRERKLGVIDRLGKGTSVAVTLTSSRDNDVATNQETMTAFGTFETKFKIPEDAPLGYWRLAAKSGKGEWFETFRVEEYRAPQFKVDVSVPSEALRGDLVKAQVSGRYLFGGAMNGAKVEWGASSEAYEIAFEPPGHEGFSFGPHGWVEGYGMGASVTANGGGELDAEGLLEFEVGRAETPGDMAYRTTVEVTITDANRQTVSNRASFVTHPASVYVGLKPAQQGFAEARKPVTLQLIAAAPDGALKAGIDLSLEVTRKEWKSIRKRNSDGEWSLETEAVETKVSDCQVKSRTEPVTCVFTPAEPGYYALAAIAKDPEGRTQRTTDGLYVVGGGWVSWMRDDTANVELVADKKIYDIGDKARILVQSPYPETDALLTVEREGVVTARTVHLKGSTTALEVPITEDLLPNAYIGVVLTRGRVPDKDGLELGDDPGRPAARFGYVAIDVERKSKRLSVQVTPDAKEKRPRDTVNVAVQVADWKGRPRKAEVLVWAVDEGVLRLTNYEAPDPGSTVHVRRSLSVRNAEPLTALLRREPFGEKGGSTGGGGGIDGTDAISIRAEFKTTPFFQTVVTDANGKATVTFTLPDNLTTYRIMAVAATDGDLFGVAKSEIQVVKPLLALPATPRFARVGDTFEAGVVVHAHGKAFPAVKVKAILEGDAAMLTGPAERTIALDDGKPREVRFAYTAKKEGVAALRFTAVGAGETDGVEQKLPIRLPTLMEAVAAYGDTTDKRVEGIVPPTSVHPNIGGLTLTTASTALGNFDESMRHLVEYPYGCTEQLSSRLIPFIALRELHGLFKVPWNPVAREGWPSWLDDAALAQHKASNPDDIVNRTVKTIESRQLAEGGFAYWDSARFPSAPGSAYAVLALARAKEVGYAVDTTVLKKGQEFLADQIAAGRCLRSYWSCETPSDATRVFALYALAKSGAPAPSYYAELYQNRAKLPLFAQTMLASAMQLGDGDKTKAKALVMEVLARGKESAGKLSIDEGDDEDRYAYLWSSSARTTAIALETLVNIDPDHPYVGKMARWLSDARLKNGRWRNTQETAFSLMALTEVVRVKERNTPDFVAKVTLGDRTLAAIPFKGRSMKVETSRFSIDEIAKAKGKLPLTFAVEGTGVLYYGAVLKYAPLELQTEALDRGVVVQRWFEPFSGGGQARTFRAGDVVKVVVRIATPMERNFLIVDVPLPAGLEAIDTSLASSMQIGPPQRSAEGDDEDGMEDEESVWWYSPFDYTEMRDDRITLFSDLLAPGVYKRSFLARATTPGEFVLKPAQAEEMYAPEVFGRSDGGKFTVVAPEKEMTGK